MINKKNIINTLIITSAIAFFSLFFNFYIDMMINKKVVERELISEKKEISIIKITFKDENIKIDSINRRNERDHKLLSNKIDNINSDIKKLNKNINILTYLIKKNNTKIKKQLNEIKKSSEDQFIYSIENENEYKLKNNIIHSEI